MSYYEARLLRYNPEEDEDDDEGMSGSTMALIAVGVLALAGGGYWYWSKSKTEAEAAKTDETGDSATTDSTAVATSTPPTAEVAAQNEQAKAAIVQKGGKQLDADMAYPTVTYLNGTKASLPKAEVVSLVSAGKATWTSALRTAASEVDPKVAKTGQRGLTMGGKKGDKKKGKKGKK